MSAVAKAAWPESASPTDCANAAATASVSSNAKQILKTAENRRDADVACEYIVLHCFNSKSKRVILITMLPTADNKKVIHVMDDEYEIRGVDAIWHNQYRGPESDFGIMRRQYDSDINFLLQLVASHVSQGLYTIISLNATKHSLVVVCGCQKMEADMPPDMFHE
jgi:hypothetical protein